MTIQIIREALKLDTDIANAVANGRSAALEVMYEIAKRHKAQFYRQSDNRLFQWWQIVEAYEEGTDFRP